MKRFALLALAPLVAILAAGIPGSDLLGFQSQQAVNPISFGGDELKSAFNEAKDHTRLVLVFSPT